MVCEGFSEEVQWHALSLLRLATHHSLLAQLELQALGGIGLVQQVLRSPRAAVSKRIAEVRVTPKERELIHTNGSKTLQCPGKQYMGISTLTYI